MKLPTDIVTESQKPRALSRALLCAGAQQVIFFCLIATALCDDGGALGLKWFYAFVAYWVGFTIVIIRRRKRLTKIDLEFVRYGYLALLVVSFVIAPFIWQLRGMNMVNCA